MMLELVGIDFMCLVSPETSKARKALTANGVQADRLRDKPGACAPPREAAELSARRNRSKSRGAASAVAHASLAIDNPCEVAFGGARSVSGQCRSVLAVYSSPRAQPRIMAEFCDMRECQGSPLRAPAIPCGRSSFLGFAALSRVVPIAGRSITDAASAHIEVNFIESRT
jgi:hypothetical protein